MKTHSRTDITDQFPVLNLCIKHRRKPDIVLIVAGRRKDKYYCACCEDDDCGKISDSGPDVVAAWNKWNPE